MNGLHRHKTPVTAKLIRLPTDSPPTRQKLATVAATSTSSLRPFSLGLCSTDAEAIMPSVETYPFDQPKARRINMNIQSEEITGWRTSVDRGD